jgi:AhpD family alkylhydroperoxidase
MARDLLPQTTPELSAARKKRAPQIHDAFTAFSERVFADGALPVKTKQLIAVAAAHITQCPYCIRGHTKAALRHGATAEEIMEAIWVAAEMRAGAAYAHSVVALDAVEEVRSRQAPKE